MASLDIIDIDKRFGDVHALRGINLSLDEGGFLVLVGPSGCGKSTLLNAIAGLEPTSGGEIRIDGASVNDRHPSDRDIAMVFQSYALYPSMNVADNMAFGLEMRGVPKPQRNEAVAEVARMLQIEHLLKRRPRALSGGQRQRVAMGRALVRKPSIFLFDEPLSNLDAKLRIDMRTEIKRLHQRLGATIVYVTHDQVEAMTLATRIAVLRDGEVQQVGTPAEVYGTPANVFVAEFMGAPTMNLLRARVEVDDASIRLRLTRDGSDVTLAVPDSHRSAAALAAYAGKDVLFGLRPESVGEAATQVSEANVGHDVSASFDCRVEIVEPTGADTFVVTHLADKEFMARLPAGAAVTEGQQARFAADMSEAHFFDAASERRI